MNIKVQRFKEGHPLYTDNWIENINEKAGVLGKFQSNFGQIINVDTNEFVCFSMERRDTLIPIGKYNFKLYFSPANKLTVPLLENVPGFEYIEIHPANWVYQLKGCTAPGENIDLKAPAIIKSVAAWDKIIALIGKDDIGTVEYEYLENEKISA